jgi:hypothetical protein
MERFSEGELGQEFAETLAHVAGVEESRKEPPQPAI